uniref:Uncharacterized protein n=1 Tax=Rhodopseudomonas palustris (strain BisA53) TaxID=316055 RepID=Q07QJ9_RHOP5
MDVKASGRAALVIAAGLWMAGFWVMGSAQAAPAAASAASEKQPAKPQPAKKTAKPVAEKPVAAKPAADKSNVDKAVADKPNAEKTGRVSAVAKPKSASGKPLVEPAPLASAADVEAPLPDSIANANAQIPVADAAINNGVAREPAADSQVVASDQLNDLDLAAIPAASPPSTIGQSTGVVTAQAPHDDSLWSQTSLIGKIFIAFGGLLTAASAARMFIV